jgi:hypothetical protein
LLPYSITAFRGANNSIQTQVLVEAKIGGCLTCPRNNGRSLADSVWRDYNHRKEAAMGPIVLFDKSFVEMLNIDEATVFDTLYSSVICPIFYTEVLADLSKEPPGQRTAERIVADVVRKTPIMHATPNVLHSTLCLDELLGHPIEMRGVPAITGGRPVRQNGRVGVVYEQSSEAKAFDRWQHGKFYELEREFASSWRAQLKGANHADMAKLAKAALKIRASPKSFDDAFAIAKEVVQGEGQRFWTLRTAYALLGLDPRQWKAVLNRWKEMGGPPLPEYAPYTAHCLLVDVFFHVAVDKTLISPDRPSNRTDIAYLYYLPFAMMFVSNDKLHRRTAPLFLTQKQHFVSGGELKKDLQALDAHYSALSEVEKAQGLFRLASTPPNDEAFLTTRIWKRFGMNVEKPSKRFDHNENKEANDRIVAEMNKMVAAAENSQGKFSAGEMADPDGIVIQRLVPLQRGKWRLMPPEVKADAT